MQTTPSYDIAKIRYATDPPTFQRAIDLYTRGKVSNFESLHDGFGAIIEGSRAYKVFVTDKHYDRGYCDCYLGRTDVLCKHMVAVAIMAIKNGQPLSETDTKTVEVPHASGQMRELSPGDIARTKREITAAIRYIKAYTGPSRTWLTYQNSLQEGCNRLSDIISKLPVSAHTAKLVVDILLRLDHKLISGGVDDSDGTVSGFIQDGVIVLKQYVYLDPACRQALYRLTNQPTSFDWEDPLVELLKE